MKDSRRIALSMLAILLLAGVLPTLLQVPVVHASSTIHVPGEYSTIQAAVDHTSPGDTVLVSDGLYIENINVNTDHLVIKSVNGPSKTIIQAADTSDHVIEVHSDYVEINGFQVRGTTTHPASGISYYDADHGIIDDVVSYNNYYGIQLIYSSHSLINNSVIYSNEAYGIQSEVCSYNTITDCELSYNGIGMLVYFTEQCTLRNNHLVNNAHNFEFACTTIAEYNQDIDTSNTINGLPIYYIENQSNLVFDETMEIGFLGLLSCRNVQVRNINTYGILFANVSSSIITNCTSHESAIGIELGGQSRNNIIADSTGYDNYLGIAMLEGSDYNLVTHCVLANNQHYGLFFRESSFNEIRGCSTHNNGYGTALFYAWNNSIIGNDITSNGYGVFLLPSSSIYQHDTINNKFYHNNITANSWGQVDPRGTTSIWDNGYPQGGNYWDDYTGVDQYSGPGQNIVGSDGIADTPRVIDSNNEDRYPLMQPWKPPTYLGDGFESGGFNAWTGTIVTSGETSSIVSSTQHHGIYSAKFTSNGGGGFENAYCYKTLAAGELYARGYFQISQSGINSDNDRIFLMVFRAGNNGLAYAGWKRTAGQTRWCITIRDGTRYLDVFSSTGPSTGRWYCVELRWLKDSANGLVGLYVDGVLVCLAEGYDTSAYGDVTAVQCGLAEAYGCGSTTVYSDCLKLSDTYVGLEKPMIVFQDGFESGTFSSLTGTGVTTGETTSVSTTRYHHGARSATFYSNGGGGTERSYCYKTLSSSLSDLHAGGYFYISSSGIRDNYDRFQLIAFRTSGTSTIAATSVAYAGWYRTGSGNLRWFLTIKSGTSSVTVYSSTAPVTGRWYSVELHWRKGTSTGLGELYVNGVRICSITGRRTDYYGSVSSVRMGLPELYSCSSTRVYMDCVRIAQSYIGIE